MCQNFLKVIEFHSCEKERLNYFHVANLCLFHQFQNSILTCKDMHIKCKIGFLIFLRCLLCELFRYLQVNESFNYLDESRCCFRSVTFEFWNIL